MASVTKKNSKKKKGKIAKERKSIKEEKLELYLPSSVKVVLQKRAGTKSKNFMGEELNFILGFSLKHLFQIALANLMQLQRTNF